MSVLKGPLLAPHVPQRQPSLPHITRQDAVALALKIAKVMSKGGSSAKRIEDTVSFLLQKLKYHDPTILVHIHSVTISLQAESGEWFTRASDMTTGVHLDAVVEASRFCSEVHANEKTAEELDEELESFLVRPHYGRIVTSIAIAVTCCCISIVLGSDIEALPAVFVATLLGMLLRKTCEHHAVNIYATWFVTAYVTATVSLLITRYCQATGTPIRATLAPTLMLVPGVPIVNTFLDLVRRYSDTGAARLAFVVILVMLHGHGVMLAFLQFGLLTGNTPPGVEAPSNWSIDKWNPVAGGLLDAALSGLASFGFALLFQVPRRLLFVSSIVGCIGHGLKAYMMRYFSVFTGGADFLATFCMCLVAELLSKYAYKGQTTPPIVFYIPGLVLLMPGLFLMEAHLQFMWIVQMSSEFKSDPTRLASAFFDGFVPFMRSFLIIGGIGTGVALPPLLFRMNESVFESSYPAQYSLPDYQASKFI